VSSYLAFPPLPKNEMQSIHLGGLFLLHFPSSRLDRELPGTLPYGARTFLVYGLSALHTRPSGLLIIFMYSLQLNDYSIINPF